MSEMKTTQDYGKDSNKENLHDDQKPRTTQAGAFQASEDIIKEKIKKILRKHDAGDKFSHLLLPKASVLIPIIIKDGKMYLLFTVRSKELKTSPGDVCFPGGRKEPADRDDIETALREAEEEVGLPKEQAEVIGRLPPTITMAGYLVTPVVALIDKTFQPRSNPVEVADVFTVPLDYFVEPEKHSSMLYKFSEEVSGLTHYFEYEDPQTNKSFRIWGITANFALVLAILVLGKKPLFDVDFNIEDMIPSYERFLIKLYNYRKSNL